MALSRANEQYAKLLTGYLGSLALALDICPRSLCLHVYITIQPRLMLCVVPAEILCTSFC